MHPFDPLDRPPRDPWPAIERQGESPSSSSYPASEAEQSSGSAEELPLPADGVLDPVFLDDIDVLLMSQAVFHEASAYFGSRAPEAAAILLGPKSYGCITHLLPDETGEATPVSFTLDATQLNRRVKPYLAAQTDIKGVIHLHPRGIRSLSYGDLLYARKIFRNPKNAQLECFLMPLWVDGRMIPYTVRRDGGSLVVCHARLVLF